MNYRNFLTWALFFLFIQIVCQLPGGTNARSRGATLLALVEDHSFAIDSYLNLTVDWAHPPNGHYYSNKAPGPVFLALPVFWVLDSIECFGITDRVERDRLREQNLNANLRTLSILLQVFPLCLLAFLWVGFLQKQGISEAALCLFLVALFFGTTASVLMNTFFGHGLAAVFLLATLLALCQKKWAFSAFCYGWALLCDYGVAVYLPGFFFFFFRQATGRENFSGLVSVFKGAFVPALFWIGFHLSVFGSPWTLPYRFQNPEFIDKAHETVQLWGILGLPSAKVAWELLFGTQRGIFITQPWVLFLISWLLLAFRKQTALIQSILGFVLSGFLVLFLMNAAFGGWHGGACPGPRYLSIGLILFAPVLALHWDSLSRSTRGTLFITLVYTALFSLMVLSVYEMPREDKTIVRFYWDWFSHGPTLTPWIREGLAALIFGRILYRTVGRPF